ncbi:metal tolerance protein B-like [Salvia hispanica]|uniref:metal tolerance protein B-like n=1 Tax=Salvia hispanica TaxID=49212 RepID=UPI0020097A7F|nr:metal tolerance protein B-like [Salvia hispanica]XP_047979651.1 metal tolerance protein B-like [Salvia hispanica]XP_047979652.1 metal tolerance protein B-like [Salvia hispanica]XP_047979653.1 metal tolerance protein B-like [Salvia hispanica]XP_047979654.1 metal tolerance protein B-like [Salvia hispanica]
MGQENSDSIESSQVKIDLGVAIGQEMTNLPLVHKFSCSSTCPFIEHGYSQSDSAQRSKAAIKLCGLIVCYLIVMVIEAVGGLKANSLAILTDAAHLLSDVAGLSISLFTVWVSGWTATPEHSFGYHRVEVIGALLSVQLIWVMSVSLIYEAIKRLVMKQTEVNGRLMFVIAAFSLVVNVIMVLWLGHDHSHHGHSHQNCKDDSHSHEKEESTTGDEESTNLISSPHGSSHMLNINIRGAYLHIICDCIQSVAAMVAGVFIWIKPKWLVADLICTLLFTTFALSTTFTILRDIFHVLMERAPSDIDVARLGNGLKLITGVRDVHDLHIWAITSGKHVLSCHVVVGAEVSPQGILHEIKEYCERTYKISHVTIQVEHA